MHRIGSVLIVAMMVLMCADIGARSLFNKPIYGVAELVALSVTAIVFLQLASTLRHGRLTRVEAFIDSMQPNHPRIAAATLLVSHLLGAAALAAMTYTIYPGLLEDWRDKLYIGVEGLLTVPTWPVKLVVVVGSAVTSLQFVLLAAADLGVLAGHGARET